MFFHMHKTLLFTLLIENNNKNSNKKNKMDDKMDEDIMDLISDVSTDSIHESPTKNVPKIQFSKHPKNVREYAAKIRKIERKIMLGLLSDTEENKLKGSKYFSKRFEKLLNLSNSTKKGNLYKLVTGVSLNEKLTGDLQKKLDAKGTSQIARRKLQTKLHNLRIREKSVQEKVTAGNLSQNDVDSFLRDQYFTVIFGDKMTLDHPPANQKIYRNNNMSTRIDWVKFRQELSKKTSTNGLPVLHNIRFLYPHINTSIELLSKLQFTMVRLDMGLDVFPSEKNACSSWYDFSKDCNNAIASTSKKFIMEFNGQITESITNSTDSLSKDSSFSPKKSVNNPKSGTIASKKEPNLPESSKQGTSSSTSTIEQIHPKLCLIGNLARQELCIYQYLKDLKLSRLKCKMKTDLQLEVERVYFVPLYKALKEQLKDADLLYRKKNKRPKLLSKGEELSKEPEEADSMLCDYCQSSNEKNRFGQREDLLECKDCSNKAHPSCLNYSKELVEQIRSDGSWQCIDCKACFICNGTGDPDSLLFCDACDKGYHMQCHTPKLEQTPSGKWACATCLAKGKTVASVTTKQVLVIEDEDAMPQEEKEEKDKTVKEEERPPSNEALPTTVSTASVTPADLVPVQTVHPQTVEKPATDVHLHVAPAQQIQQIPVTPIVSVKPSTVLYQSPNGLTYTQLPMGVQIPAPPVHGNQTQLIPVNYMLPNGSHAPIPQHIPHAIPSPHTLPTIQPTPQPPQPAQQIVLGKGMRNDLTHILNPKVPLPDVRSSIREDVLRALPPDVADWSVQNVVYYFKSHGYVQESNLLEGQEIDGRAMLLMSRNDCLTGLRIKLGPALKIYHMHIHKLQKRTDFLG